MRGFKVIFFWNGNIFISSAICVRLNNTHAFGHCVIYFGQCHRAPKSEGASTPMFMPSSSLKSIHSKYYGNLEKFVTRNTRSRTGM